jgi:hypothetical protein
MLLVQVLRAQEVEELLKVHGAEIALPHVMELLTLAVAVQALTHSPMILFMLVQVDQVLLLFGM